MAYTMVEQVKIRLKQFHIDADDSVVFDHKEDNPLIEQLVEQAQQEVTSRRMYPSSYTQEQIDSDMKNYEGVIVLHITVNLFLRITARIQIDSDMKNYEGVIVNLAVYDKSQAGEAYMATYTENGVSRAWKDRENLLVGVYPFVKAL